MKQNTDKHGPVIYGNSIWGKDDSWKGKVFFNKCSWKQRIAIWNKAKLDPESTIFILSQNKNKILKYNGNSDTLVESVGE